MDLCLAGSIRVVTMTDGLRTGWAVHGWSSTPRPEVTGSGTADGLVVGNHTACFTAVAGYQTVAVTDGRATAVTAIDVPVDASGRCRAGH